MYCRFSETKELYVLSIGITLGLNSAFVLNSKKPVYSLNQKYINK